MNEKEVKELCENIVESIVDLSLGKEPGLLSGKVFKSVAKHPNYEKMKTLYIEFLTGFDGKYEKSEEIQKLAEFRFNLVKLFE